MREDALLEDQKTDDMLKQKGSTSLSGYESTAAMIKNKGRKRGSQIVILPRLMSKSKNALSECPMRM